MRIYSELDLNTFEAWSGAVSTLDRIREEGKTEVLETILEDAYPEGMSETELNDLLWFEEEEISRWLGIPTEAELEAEASAAAELEELLDAAGRAATFDEFCDCFGSCENCPVYGTPANDCEDGWKLWSELAAPTE